MSIYILYYIHKMHINIYGGAEFLFIRAHHHEQWLRSYLECNNFIVHELHTKCYDEWWYCSNNIIVFTKSQELRSFINVCVYEIWCMYVCRLDCPASDQFKPRKQEFYIDAPYRYIWDLQKAIYSDTSCIAT